MRLGRGRGYGSRYTVPTMNLARYDELVRGNGVGHMSGAAAQRMKAPVARLTVDDMAAIAAYLASLRP